MSETNITPLPWRIVRSSDKTGDVGITADGLTNILAEVFAESWDRGDFRPSEAYANAVLIVEAVNNHARLTAENAALVKALQTIEAWEFNFMGDNVAAARRVAREALERKP